MTGKSGNVAMSNCYNVTFSQSTKSSFTSHKSYLASLNTLQFSGQGIQPVLPSPGDDDLLAKGVESAGEALTNASGCANNQNGVNSGSHGCCTVHPVLQGLIRT